MNKTVKIVLGSTLALGVFSVGLFGKDIITKASSDWQTTAINNANSELGAAGYSKKSELVNSAPEDINATVQTAIGEDLESQKVELQKMLDAYYQLKLQGMTDSQQFKDLEISIKNIQQSIYERYTKEIDAVFASQTTQP